MLLVGRSAFGDGSLLPGRALESRLGEQRGQLIAIAARRMA